MELNWKWRIKTISARESRQPEKKIQKYESGEIEVSFAMINELAKVLDTTSTYLIGYEHDGKNIRSLSDIMDFLFKLDRVKGLNFRIDVKRPPHYDEW